MDPRCLRQRLLGAIFTLVLMFSIVVCQDNADNVPAEWLQPIGGAPVSPESVETQQNPQEVLPEQPQDVQQEAPQEQPQDAQQEAPQEQPQDAQQEAPQEQPQDAQQEVPQEQPQDAQQQESEDQADQISEELDQQDDSDSTVDAIPAADASADPSSINQGQEIDPENPVQDAENDNGNLGPSFDDLPPDNLPPAPPSDWSNFPLDTTIILGLELYGPVLVPWTKPKSWVFNTVLVERYLRSCDINDIETGALETWRSSVPSEEVDGATGRKLQTIVGSGRKLLQTEYVWVTGVLLRVKINTNVIRAESEVNTLINGINSGSLAKDVTTSLGSEVTNITLTQQPAIVPFDELPDPNEGSGGSLPGWIIGIIVGSILVVLPIPIYLIHKRRRRRHIEALEKQAAEAAAARQRMQSRVIKSGGKSFLQHSGGTSLGVLDDPEFSDRMAALNDFSDAPSVDSLETGSRLGSTYKGGSPTALGAGRAPSFASTRISQRSYLTPEQQQSFLRYQSQSLGGSGFLPSQHARSPTTTPSHNRQLGGAAVFPAPFTSDESSSSSGNYSIPKSGEK